MTANVDESCESALVRPCHTFIGTRELFQLGVEGGEFVRHLGGAHGFDPLALVIRT
jgi:hypothetical protein